MTERPLNILYVHHNADTYGASRSLVRLLQNLDRSKFRPLVVLPSEGPLRGLVEAAQAETLLHPGLSVITRPVFRSWRLIPFLAGLPLSVIRLRAIIRNQRIDLVHTNTGIILSSALAARLAGTPHVWHIRDWFGEFGLVWKSYSRYILWSSSRVIAVSKAIAQQFSRSEKVTVVNNGFSLAEFTLPKADLRTDFRKRFELGNDFVVGCVGRIKLIRKGQEILVRAAALLARRGLRPKILLVGAPSPGNESHLDELRRLVDELNLQASVVFVGELPDPRPAYAAMDLFVLPSAQPEPFAGVVMEAMAMGLPVIATNIGGSTEQVDEGRTGFLVPPSDPEALADKIALLMNDPELRVRMGEAGPVRIETQFSLEEMARNIESIYLTAVNRAAISKNSELQTQR